MWCRITLSYHFTENVIKCSFLTCSDLPDCFLQTNLAMAAFESVPERAYLSILCGSVRSDSYFLAHQESQVSGLTNHHSRWSASLSENCEAQNRPCFLKIVDL